MWSHVIVSCMPLKGNKQTESTLFSSIFTVPFQLKSSQNIGAVTRKKELQLLQASPKRYRGHLTKLFKRSEDILAKQNLITELDLASASTTLDNLKKKGKKLQKLDGEIAPKINKSEDLEQEITEEENQEQIAEICAKCYS